MYVFLAFLTGLILGAIFHRQLKLFLVFIIALICDFIYWLRWVAWPFLRNAWAALKRKWGPHMDTLRKKLVVLAVVLFYLLWALISLMFLAFMGAGWALLWAVGLILLALLIVFLFSEFWGQVVSAVTAIGLLLWISWKALTEFFGGFGTMLSEFGGWIASLWDEFVRWLAAVLSAVSLGLCSGPAPEKAPEPPASQPVKRYEIGQVPQKAKVLKLIKVQPREGCIALTKRAGYPLSLSECREAAEEYERKIERRGRFTLAPNIGRGEIWNYVSEGGREFWVIPGPKGQTVKR